MSYVKGDPREPFCVHSLQGQRQPASMCRICKDGPDLAEWKAYWAEHSSSIPQRLDPDVATFSGDLSAADVAIGMTQWQQGPQVDEP